MSTPVNPTATPDTIAGYKVHPAAALMPAPTLEEHERLKVDIKEHGLRVHIVLTPDGQILDGRTRAQICDELGIDYTRGFLTTRFASADEMLDPMAFVLSMNAARRHLSATKIVEIYLDAQKAKIEADQEAARAAQRSNLKQGEARGAKTTASGRTTAKIAEATGVSESTVKNVLRGKKAASEGLADVAAGKISAGEALKGSSGRKKNPKGKVPTTKAKTVTGKGYVGYYTTYGTGRRSIEALIDNWQLTMRSMGSEAIGLQFLADARRIGHPKFDQWMKVTVDWHAKVGAVLHRLQHGHISPTGEEIEELLDPDRQQDEVAGDPGEAEPEPRPTRAQGAAPAAAEP